MVEQQAGLKRSTHLLTQSVLSIRHLVILMEVKVFFIRLKETHLIRSLDWYEYCYLYEHDSSLDADMH